MVSKIILLMFTGNQEAILYAKTLKFKFFIEIMHICLPLA